jgi:predicted DNA-binding helix-hairpin-helix protein
VTLVRAEPAFETKLATLSRAASHDLSCACGPSEPRRRGPDGLWIYPAALPSGKRVPMLKVLQSSGCERACVYCVERLGGQCQPLTLGPDELARAFVDLHDGGHAFGLFLSSAVRGGPVATMDRMLATAEILRGRHRFRGYVHLKVIPGCRPDQVERAMALATRVSVNMEAPTAAHLARIAPGKRFFDQILAPMRQIARAEADGTFARAGQTTQLVVGAAGETDREIATSVAWMYGKLKLARVYYSALQPTAGTPTAVAQPVPFMREHRLYEVDFLLRKYGFDLEEIGFDDRGHLPLDVDPKTAWARRHPERFPVEVNTAPVSELVRIPGVGPRSAKMIASMRRDRRLGDIAALRSSGASWKRAAPYVLLDGKHAVRQLAMF